MLKRVGVPVGGPELEDRPTREHELLLGLFPALGAVHRAEDLLRAPDDVAHVWGVPTQEQADPLRPVLDAAGEVAQKAVCLAATDSTAVEALLGRTLDEQRLRAGLRLPSD